MLADLRAPQVALLLCGFAVGAAAARGHRWRGWRAALAAGTVVACMTWHGIVLLLYWQILPAYVACVLGLVCLGASLTRAPRRVLGLAAVALIVGSAVCLAVAPLFRLPKPTGRFAVGTTILHLVDPNRADTSFPSGHREIMAQAWYPSAGAGPIARYRRWRETTLLSSYDAALPTNSRADAPPADGRFPLLLFNPAWEGQRTQYTYLAEELASHGFVVVSIDHTHNSMPVAFPDGQVLRSTEPRAVDDFSGVDLEQVLRFANEEIETEIEDDLLVLNAFAGWVDQPLSRWSGRVDLDHVGALGHSFGGAVAFAACGRDQRILSALNLDGWIFGALDRPVGKPLFDVNSGDWPFNPPLVARERASSAIGDRLDVRDLDRIERSMASSGGYLLAIEGATHSNFSDRALYSPLRRLTEAGPRDARQVHAVVRAYAVAFFSHTLKGTPEPLLEKGADESGVHFRGR